MKSHLGPWIFGLLYIAVQLLARAP